MEEKLTALIDRLEQKHSLETEEYRYPNPKKGKRAVRCDRIPLKLLGQVALDTPEDHLALLPEDLPEKFGAKEIAFGLRISEDIARIMLRVMESAGAVKRIGKEGRRNIFTKLL